MNERTAGWFAVGVALTCGFSTLTAAPRATEREVQRLANVFALQKLSREGDAATNGYLRAVAARYRAEGYAGLGASLGGADAVIELLGSRTGAGRPRALRAARTELRAIRKSLGETRTIALPTGDRVPNYYALAAAFAAHGEQAVKNVAKGRNVANFLRNKTGELWIVRVDEGEFRLAGGSVEILNDIASFTLGSSTYSAMTLIGGGTLSVGGASGGVTMTGGSVTTIGGGGLIVNSGGGLNLGGTLHSQGTLNPTTETMTLNSGRWILFPAGTAVPAEWEGGRIVLGRAYLISGVEYPIGTTLIQAPADAIAPEGTSEPTLPIRLEPVPSPSPTTAP